VAPESPHARQTAGRPVWRARARAVTAVTVSSPRERPTPDTDDSPIPTTRIGSPTPGTFPSCGRFAAGSCGTRRRVAEPCAHANGKRARTGQAGDDGRARYRARCASSTSAVDRTCGVRAARNETLGETTCAPPAHHSHSPSAFQRKRTNAYPRTGVPGPRYVRSTLEDPARLLRRRDRRLHAGIRMAVGADPLQRPP
jgi:hypothetical protein